MKRIWFALLAYNVLSFLLAGATLAWGQGVEARLVVKPPKLTPMSPPPTPAPGAVAVIIAGQSNAVGRGTQTPADSTPEYGVYVIKGDGKVYSGADPLSITVPSGVGFGRTLARTLIDTGYAPEVWLITCAIGSTSATSWANAPLLGTYHQAPEATLYPAVGSWLYSDCLMQALLARRMGLSIVATAWHQGENGCGSLAETSARVARLTTIRDRFKSDFPGSVFVGGELSRSNTCAYLEETNAATEQVSDAYVSSEGLTNLVGDPLHFDRASQIELGYRYGAAIYTLLTRPLTP